MEKEDEFYESSGAGLVAQGALDLFVDNHYAQILRVLSNRNPVF